MVRQSRLRVQKSKNYRRAFFFVLLITVVTVAGWQADERYQIIDYIKEVISTVRETAPADSISRGTIYDRNLKQIAVTMARVSVYARIKEIKSISETVKELGSILSLDMERLQKKLATGSLRVWVAEDISLEQEDAIKEKELPGVYLQREQVRFYPNDAYAAHLTGYVDNNIGLAGVEFYYNRLLANRKVEEKIESNQLNYSQDLVLTVDLKIQKILEDLVTDIGNQQHVTKVAAYVMEGATGDIVGGAQYPGFNPNDFTRYSTEVLENIFLKPIAIPPKFRLLLRDAANIYSSIEAGRMSLPWSIRIFKPDLGSQLRLWDWLGLTEQWSTDFSVYNHTDKNKGTDTSPFPSSQYQSYGLVPEQATPLKILTAMAGIFSGGNKIRPHVVAAVSDAESGKEYRLNANETETDLFADIVKEGAMEMEWMLRSQATQGSSGALLLRDENLLFTPFPWGPEFSSNEMVLVVIPADITTLRMLVVVEGHPEFPLPKKRLKNTFLEKRVGQIIDRISVLQQIGKSVSDVVEIETKDEGNYPLKKNVDALVPDNLNSPGNGKVAMGKIPDLKGLSLRRSLQLLQHHNVKIRFRGTGRVVSQKPPPGTPLQGVSECFLILEKVEDMKIEKMIESGP
jgi:cell division protein FtsI (penicillin-binding protein 3)